MTTVHRLAALAASATLALAAYPAQAAQAVPLRFEADLTGKAYPDQTGSKAEGHAVLTLHPDSQAVDLVLNVKDLNRDALWDKLVLAPVGPMHVHLYLPNGDVELIMAFPFGKAYRDTRDDLRVRAKGIVYAENAAMVGSKRSFSEFADALRSGNAYLNLHTDKFNDGEIAGKIMEETSGR